MNMEQPTTIPQTIKEYSIESIRATTKIYLSLLGPWGIAVDEVLFGIGERVRAKRLEDFVKILSEKIDRSSEQKIDQEYFKSEDFYDLTVNIINASVKTNSLLKHELLSQLFIEGVNEKIKWETGIAFIFVSYINEMSEKHILIFKYLFENRDKLKYLDSFENLFQTFTSETEVFKLDKYEFRMYLRDLENKTLVRFSKNIHEYGSSGGYVEAESSLEIPGLIITSIGENFSKYLKE